MKRVLFILLIGLVLGCAGEVTPIPEVDIDATVEARVEARVAEELEKNEIEPTATALPKPTATALPKPTATALPKPTATALPEPTAKPIDFSNIYDKRDRLYLEYEFDKTIYPSDMPDHFSEIVFFGWSQNMTYEETDALLETNIDNIEKFKLSDYVKISSDWFLNYKLTAPQLHNINYWPNIFSNPPTKISTYNPNIELPENCYGGAGCYDLLSILVENPFETDLYLNFYFTAKDENGFYLSSPSMDIYVPPKEKSFKVMHTANDMFKGRTYFSLDNVIATSHSQWGDLVQTYFPDLSNYTELGIKEMSPFGKFWEGSKNWISEIKRNLIFETTSDWKYSNAEWSLFTQARTQDELIVIHDEIGFKSSKTGNINERVKEGIGGGWSGRCHYSGGSFIWDPYDTDCYLKLGVVSKVEQTYWPKYNKVLILDLNNIDIIMPERDSMVAPTPTPTPTPVPIPAEYSLNVYTLKETKSHSGFACISDYGIEILNTGDTEDVVALIRWYDINNELLDESSISLTPHYGKFMRATLSDNNSKLVSNWLTIIPDPSDCWKYSDVTKDLYGKGVIVINGEEFPFVEVTIE